MRRPLVNGHAGPGGPEAGSNSVKLCADLLMEVLMLLSLFLLMAMIGIAPVHAQVQFPNNPGQKLHSFTCGPHLLTYEVYSTNGQRGKGVRCVKVKMWPPKIPGVPTQFDFAWYGEGDWGAGPYRHIGYAFNNPELPNISAADIFGNGEKFDGAYLGSLDNHSNNIALKQIIGNWPAPDEIHLDGAWKEVWKRVSATSYQPLSKITTCGPHFYEYQSQSPDPIIPDRGVRCVSKHFAVGVWFGSGKWGAKEYAHLGIHEWSPDGNGLSFQPGAGEASDICYPAVGAFCSITPPKAIEFTRQGSDIKLGGAWNELWVARERFRISVLTINLRGVVDVPCRTGVRWDERFRRIATWMKDTGNRPDIIPLQEAVGWVWCPTNFQTIEDYTSLDLLLDAIRDATGEQYRIAYLVDTEVHGGLGDCGIGGGVLGGCKVWGSRALLYRSSRLRNDLASVFSNAVAHDDGQVTGPHLRRSLPACNMASSRTDVQNVIDGIPQVDKCNRPTPSGLTWVQRQGGATNGPFDAAFSRFELINYQGKFIHVYNVHLSWTPPSPIKTPGSVETPEGSGLWSTPRPGVENVTSLVTAVENRFATTPTSRLFAPLLVGDFNFPEDGSELFPDFRVAKWTREVIGALVGKENVFPSIEIAHVKKTEVLPLPDCETAPGGVPGGGGPIGLLWSDHCALYFTIEATP